MSSYQLITNKKDLPKGRYNYFLVRVQGIYYASGKPFVPYVVYRKGKIFYDPVSEQPRESLNDPWKRADRPLEWCPLPE